MTANRFGVDQDYFEEKLALLQRDLGNHTPQELARVLARLATVAHQDTLQEFLEPSENKDAIAILCTEKDGDGDWFKYEPLKPGSERHIHRQRSDAWLTLPVFAHSGTPVPAHGEVWRDLELGEKIVPGDRFLSGEGEWTRIKPEHLEFEDHVSEATRPTQRMVHWVPTLGMIKEAYEDGYYEGAGDDAWDSDHGPDGELLPNAYVHQPMQEYLLQPSVLEGLISASPVQGVTGTHHELKTDPALFHESIAGRRPWEIRLNDRAFKAGDTVTLMETRFTGDEMASGFPLEYTGRTQTGVIGFVLRGPAYGIADKWCVFSLLPVTASSAVSTPAESTYHLCGVCEKRERIDGEDGCVQCRDYFYRELHDPEAAELPEPTPESVSAPADSFELGVVDLQAWPPIRFREGLVRADLDKIDGAPVYAISSNHRQERE